MKVYRSFTDITVKNAVVTTGSFDGVHVGHKVIIDRLNSRAKELNGKSVLITFYPHPRKVLYPETAGKDLLMINSQNEKIDLLEKMGLDYLIIVEFTSEFSKTSSVDFIRKFLVNQLQVKHVIIGFNHHFGRNREGSIEYLQELGKFYNFSVEEIPEQDIHNESVSSTKIRKSLNEGYIQRANAYLDHPYVLFSSIKEILFKGTQKVFSIKINDGDKLLPPPGGYAISFQIQAERFKGVIWILENSRDNSELWMSIADSSLLSTGESLHFEFHKRISNSCKADSFSSKIVLADLGIVEELIY